MLDRGVSGAQVSWSVVTGIYRTFWISNYIQNYFWYQTFLNVSTSFIIRYTLRVVFYISKADWWNIKTREALKVYQKVHFLDRFFFCKDFNQLNFFFFLQETYHIILRWKDILILIGILAAVLQSFPLCFCCALFCLKYSENSQNNFFFVLFRSESGY